jgi:hypothetical protein
MRDGSESQLRRRDKQSSAMLPVMIPVFIELFPAK